MAQRYAPGIAHERMAEDKCPECGQSPSAHNPSLNFWEHPGCTLTPTGVVTRVEQYREDMEAAR